MSQNLILLSFRTVFNHLVSQIVNHKNAR